MLRQDHEVSIDETLDILRRAEYGCLSMVTPNREPYAVPMSFVLAGREIIYFDCSLEGEKLDYIRENINVCFSTVTHAKALPLEFTIAYESAVITGYASVVENIAEKRGALLLLAEKYAGENKANIPGYIFKHFDNTHVIRLDIIRASGRVSRPEAFAEHEPWPEPKKEKATKPAAKKAPAKPRKKPGRKTAAKKAPKSQSD